MILRQQELVSYGLTDMVANIGGYLGLFSFFFLICLFTGGYLGLFIGLSCFAFIDNLCQFAARLFNVMNYKKHWM